MTFNPAVQRAMPDLGLAGQTALVTGATSGIGKATALALGGAGVEVAVNFRSGGQKRADAVVDAIVGGGGSAFAVEADVSRERDVRRMFGEIVERAGTLQITTLYVDGGMTLYPAFRGAG